MELQVGVKALLKNKQGKYLLVHRSAEKYQNIQGTWDIVGGRINPGFTLLENLKREIKEEVGLMLTAAPQLIAAQDILRNNDRHVVRLTYIADIEGEIILDLIENDKYLWLNFEELNQKGDVDMYLKELLTQNLIKP